MRTPLSLRARLLVGAALWTTGLFGIAGVTWHVMLGYRHPPALFGAVFSHTGMFSLVSILLMVAGLAQVRRGFAPLHQLRTRLVGLRNGEQRRLEGDYPAEVEPLVGDLNALLDQREQMIGRARSKAGDLAHGLRTPLAVLAQEAESAGAAGQLELAAAIRQQVDRMRRQVDYHLAQARAGASDRLPSSAAVSVQAAAEDLARTMRHLHAGRNLLISVDVSSDLLVGVDREDLDEMLGNLLDNACKWARSRASVSTVTARGQVTLIVEDDGSGIEPSMRAAVLNRGVRADEAAPGSGLGLSIVCDLAEAYGGSVRLDQSAMGGVRAALTLPAS